MKKETQRKTERISVNDMIPVISTEVLHTNPEEDSAYINKITKGICTHADGKIDGQSFNFHYPNVAPLYEGATLYLVLEIPKQGINYYQRYVGKERPRDAVLYIYEEPEERDEGRHKLAMNLHFYADNQPEKNCRTSFDKEIDSEELARLKGIMKRVLQTVEIYDMFLESSQKKLRHPEVV